MCARARAHVRAHARWAGGWVGWGFAFKVYGFGLVGPIDENRDTLLLTCCCLGARCRLVYRLEPSGNRQLGFAMLRLLSASFCTGGNGLKAVLSINHAGSFPRCFGAWAVTLKL